LARALDATNREVIFASLSGESVSVKVEDNTDGLTLRAWYAQQAPNAKDEDIIDFTNKNGLKGIVSPDGFTVYIARGRFVYYIHYDIGLKEEVLFPDVFKMMLESFVFTGQAGN
jgi:hypothetical protein